jgi:hypothetical protein
MKTLLAPLIVALFAPPPKDANEYKDIYGAWKIEKIDKKPQVIDEKFLALIPRYYIISKDSVLHVFSPDDEKPVFKATLKRDVKLQRLTLHWDLEGKTQAEDLTYELNEAKDKLILRSIRCNESNNEDATVTFELTRAKRK